MQALALTSVTDVGDGTHRLAELEQMIRKDLRAFVRVGIALREIRDGELFQLTGHKSFEAYCRQRLGIGRQHGYRLVTAATLVQDMSPIGDNLVAHESQFRPLSRLPRFNDKKRAFQLACDWAKGNPPTAKLVSQAVREIVMCKKAKKSPAKHRRSLTSDVNIIFGDSRDSSLLPKGVADLVVGSIPYNIGMAYDTWNDNLPFDEYLQCLRDWFAAARTWAHPNHGKLAVITAVDTHKHGPFPLTAHVVQAALEAGWKYKATIVWVENSTKAWPDIVKRAVAPEYHCAAECVVVFHVGEWERPCPDTTPDIAPDEYSEWSRGVWHLKSHYRKPAAHPAANPPELTDRLIRQFSFRGDLVVDPWAGSGTTLKVAQQLERKAVGIEIDEAYVLHMKESLGL
jgi:site-specific DNA-methyltransferase (adenine-specific)